VVAQDKKTAGKLFSIGELMYRMLPQNPELAIKPPIANRSAGRPCISATRRMDAEAGNIGINSSSWSTPPTRWKRGEGRPTPPSTPPRLRSGPTSKRSCSACCRRFRTTRTRS
jgi:hypothetical protein